MGRPSARVGAMARHRPRLLVAFDLGGVLFDIDVHRFLDAAAHTLAVTREAVAQATFDSGAWAQAEIGALDADGFPAAVLAELGLADTPAARRQLVEAWCAIPRLRPGVGGLLGRLRTPACAWSNTDPVHRLIVEQGPLGAALAWSTTSCEVGVEKPSARFFQAALQRAWVPPHRISYVDDRADNVAAARALGIDAWVATSLAGVETGLAARGLLRR